MGISWRPAPPGVAAAQQAAAAAVVAQDGRFAEPAEAVAAVRLPGAAVMVERPG